MTSIQRITVFSAPQRKLICLRDRDAVTPRTCDLLAELFAEQSDLQGALDWATVGVERCIQLGDDAELQLLLRLRYRIRVDLGFEEDDYDHMLDATHPRG